MKKLLLLTTSPTEGGKGDTLIQTAAETGICVQKDDMASVLEALHECDGLIAEAPIYYNCMAAQALLVIDRFAVPLPVKIIRWDRRKRLVYF